MSRTARQQEMDDAQQAAVEAALAADREAALRDVFAASALAAIIAEGGSYFTPTQQAMQADRAYEYADAMLKARKQ